MSEHAEVSTVEPGWEIWRDDQWVRVDMVVDTEMPDGRERRWFYSAGHKAVPYYATETIKARKP